MHACISKIQKNIFNAITTILSTLQFLKKKIILNKKTKKKTKK